MSKCAICGGHVKSGLVVHSECLKILQRNGDNAYQDGFNEGYDFAKSECRPKWKSVEEELPPEFQHVIVCRPHGNENVVEQGYRDYGGWWKVYGTRVKKVSYWMPLPAGPEEAEK